MDRKYIDDHHIVARYLADQLPDTEREAFEAYYVEHPDVVQEMEAAARFKVGLMQLRDSGQLAALLNPNPWLQRRKYLVAAASFAVIAIGLFVWFNRGPATQPSLIASATPLVDGLGKPLPIASMHMIQRTRGHAYDAQIELPETAQSIELLVLSEVEVQPPRYRVSLARFADDDSLDEVAKISGLDPIEDDVVPIYLNSSKLAPGRYQLLLSGDIGTSGADAASTFLILISDDSP